MNLIHNLYAMKEKPMDPVLDPASPAVKPGYKTTQFWITVIVTFAGFLLASGAFDTEKGPEWVDAVVRILGAIVAFGKAMGYTASRTSTTNVGIETAAALALAKVTAEVAAKPEDPTKPAE